MMKEISAVAFDIDGTFYDAWTLWRKMTFYMVKNMGLFWKFLQVRRKLHHMGFQEDFFATQYDLMSKATGMSPETVKKMVDELVYRGFEPFFHKVEALDGIREFITELKARNYPLALLSDFPPSQKGDLWGMAHFFDIAMCSEEAGALKPAPEPFLALSKKMGLSPEKILYVGNSVTNDVIGAHSVGMKTAYLWPKWKKLLNIKPAEADISFENYRQLQKIVLE
ncbi:MAG: HAD family hydrolase [Spirochaetaceae bacterium]|nr:HAD family hydrolase [Spirochaetaceae bacterium]